MCVIFHVFYSKIHKSASKGFPVCTTYSTLYRQLHKCLQSFLAWRQECEIFDLAANKFTVIFHHAKDLSLRIYWIQKGCCSCQTFTRSYAGKCSDVECEPCESQLYFSKDVSGGRGGFFIAHFSSVVVHSFYHRHVLLLHNTPTSKRKHNLPRGCWFRSENMENIWPRRKPPCCCSRLFGHILGERGVGCTDGTCHSEWLAAAAENLHARRGRSKGRGIVRNGPQLKSWWRQMPPSSCLLTRQRNLHGRLLAHSLI